MVTGGKNLEAVWEVLRGIADPEIPVISIVDMRIVSVIDATEDLVSIELTPTFSGCPALDHIKEEIRTALAAIGYPRIEIRTNFTKAWTTDLLDDATREKLRRFGIAPPVKVEGTLASMLEKPVHCPFCLSDHTHLESAFGPTLCKQIFYCDSCRQSFERFKPV
jgi:ring-1,2-phenylacetyl-CoA epoxidase subunit PaaD